MTYQMKRFLGTGVKIGDTIQIGYGCDGDDGWKNSIQSGKLLGCFRDEIWVSVRGEKQTRIINIRDIVLFFYVNSRRKKQGEARKVGEGMKMSQMPECGENKN